ncbi:MAG: tetratricopeptide repeat protein [Deltaproteobacteria bacterium]|nr:tetratricopeptide repeat protein [Deltaproteobacteria bacterium]
MKRFVLVPIAACAALLACAPVSPERKMEASARMEMGITYMEQRNLPSAMRELTKASELDPGNPEVDVALGLAYQTRGDLEKAGKYFREAIGKKSDYAEAHNNLGIVLSRQGKGEEAIREFQAAASNVLYPTPEWAYYNMGEEYRRRRDREKAEAMYRRAIGMNDRYVNAYLRLAMLQADRGRTEDAVRTLEVCVALSPDAVPAWMDLGKLFLSFGRRQDAENAFRNVLANSSDPVLRKQVSDFLNAAGKENR